MILKIKNSLKQYKTKVPEFCCRCFGFYKKHIYLVLVQLLSVSYNISYRDCFYLFHLGSGSSNKHRNEVTFNDFLPVTEV